MQGGFMKPIRVLIVDDHLIIREGLKLILETSDSIHVAGEAADGAACLEMIDATGPDVILMDLRMPRMDGLTAINHLRQSHPQIAVIILTTYNEDDLMIRGLRAGAQGYLLKDTRREQLLETIQAAARGQTLLSPGIMARVLAAPPDMSGSDASDAEEDAGSPLTEREQEVLAAVAQGQRNKEIARHLAITERTVKAHLTSIFQKLDVDSRAAAVAAAAQQGWLG